MLLLPLSMSARERDTQIQGQGGTGCGRALLLTCMSVSVCVCVCACVCVRVCVCVVYTVDAECCILLKWKVSSVPTLSQFPNTIRTGLPTWLAWCESERLVLHLSLGISGRARVHALMQ